MIAKASTPSGRSVVPPGQLVVGTQLPIQSQSSIYADAWEAAAGADALADIATAADEAGLFYIAVCDHVAIPADKAEAMSTSWWDTVATLGFLAARTKQVRLLSHVYVPAYRHPLQVAKAFATLDALSNGRVILGVGAGHVEAEFNALGVNFADRGRLLDESIDAIRGAFSSEFSSFEGDSWSFDDLGQQPRPEQVGGPPIWIGGSSNPAMRRAGERGDGWLPQGNPPKRYPEMIAQVREHRVRHLGDAPIPIDLGAITQYVRVGTVPDGLDLGPWSLSGDPASIAEGLRAWGAMGANHLQVRFPSMSAADLIDQLHRFGHSVLPLLNP